MFPRSWRPFFHTLRAVIAHVSYTDRNFIENFTSSVGIRGAFQRGKEILRESDREIYFFFVLTKLARGSTFVRMCKYATTSTTDECNCTSKENYRISYNCTEKLIKKMTSDVWRYDWQVSPMIERVKQLSRSLKCVCLKYASLCKKFEPAIELQSRLWREKTPWNTQCVLYAILHLMLEIVTHKQ